MNDYSKDFIKELEQMAYRHNIVEVFGDVVGMMSAAMWRATLLNGDEAEKVYKSFADRYTKDEMSHLPKMLEIVVRALEEKRESFLGPVLEAIGAANQHNGQFLTPADVAKVMARCSVHNFEYTPGKVIRCSDPACGAGVTLIENGEALMHERHVRQSDIMLIGGDIDRRACDMTYIELTILGYAARIDHMDALTNKVLSPSRYTICYFVYSMPMRMVA